MSFDTLWTSNKHLYFWTFTPQCVCSDREFAWGWNEWIRRFHQEWNDVRFQGLRMFERFYGGGARHGDLHCHMVCNQRLPKKAVDRWCLHTGLGWTWVNRCRKDHGAYMAKYLTKQDGAQGVRKWAKLGEWQATRKNDIEVGSSEADEFRAARAEAGSYIGARELVMQRRAMHAGRAGSWAGHSGKGVRATGGERVLIGGDGSILAREQKEVRGTSEGQAVRAWLEKMYPDIYGNIADDFPTEVRHNPAIPLGS